MILSLLLLPLAFLPTSLAEGDEAFGRMEYPAAVRAYEKALEDNPADALVLWRVARVYVCMAETLAEPGRSDWMRRAEEVARRSIAADSTRAEGHTWRAAALGYLALSAGMHEQVRLLREILAETEKALAINPGDDAAYSIRGSLYRALGNAGWLRRQVARLFVGALPPGGYEEAEAEFQRAVLLAPDVKRHHYELGVLYLDWGRVEAARQALERARDLPIRVAIDRPRQQKIVELLEQIRNRTR